MRLREIKKIIEINLPKINPVIEPHQSNNQYRTIKKYVGTLEALATFEEYDLFKTIISEIKAFKDIYNSRIDTIIIEHNIATSFINKVNELKSASIALIEVITNLISEQDENTLSIKLPPNINTIDKISFFFERINKIINQTMVNSYFQGEIKLKTLESGSLWVEIVIVSPIALTFFASLVWAGAVVRKKILEGDYLLQMVRGLEIRNDSLENINEQNQKQIDLLIESESQQILSTIENAKEDYEYLERLKISIKTFADLIHEGTEVHPSLTAPEDVKNLLPDFKKLDFIESKTKLISEKAVS